MAKITDNLHDFLQDGAWEELLSAFEDVSDMRIKPITDSVMSMRDLTTDQPDYIVQENLRMKGITLTDQILKLRKDEIYKSCHLLPNLSMLFGDPQYPRFLEYLLGRGVHIQRMYTVDYVNFFEEPQGLMVHEGGDWYLTTQVKIEVENMNELGESAEELVTELFYRYAPIEEVILGISDMIRLIGRYILQGQFFISDKEYVSLGTDIESIKLDFFPIMTSGEEYTVRCLVKRTDGSESAEIPKAINIDKCSFEYNQGKVVVDTDLDTWATVSCEHLGVFCSAGVQLLTEGLVPSPDDVYIVSSELDAYNGSGDISLQLMGVYGNHRRPVPDQSSVVWSHSNDSDCMLVGNILTMTNSIRELGRDTVTAVYVSPDGRSMTDKLHIKLHPTETGLFPVGLVINFSDRIYQGERYQILTSLKMSDGTSVEVKARVTASSPAFVIRPDLQAEAELAYMDYRITLYAEYQEDGYDFETELEVNCIYRIYKIVGTRIVGAEEVKENGTAFYKLLATWENGETCYVNATWNILLNHEGERGIKANIDGFGKLDVPSVLKDEHIIIQAAILDEGGEVHKTTHLVKVKNKTIDLVRLDLETDKQVLNQGERAYVTVYGTWSDGTATLETFDKYQIFVDTSESTFVKVDEDERGVYIEYVEGDPQMVIVYGRVNHGDRVVKTEIRYVSLIVPTSNISHVLTNRIEYMEESQRVMYGCTAVWADGRREDVTAHWSLEQVDLENQEDTDFNYTQGNFSIRSLAQILTGEDLTAEEMRTHPKLAMYEEFKEVRPVDLDNKILNRLIVQSRNLLDDVEVKVNVLATYFSSSHEQETIILPYTSNLPDKIASAAIQGPITFSATRSEVSYSLIVKYANDCLPYAVSNDWSIDVDRDIAEITSDGFIIPKKNVTTWINITASVKCGDHDFSRTLRVQMIKSDSWFDGIEIIGAEEVVDNSEVTYTATVIRNSPPTDQVEAGPTLFYVDTLAECNFDQTTGRLTVPTLYSDYEAIITARYSEYDLGKYELFDEVTGEKKIKLISQKKITKAKVLEPIGLTDSTTEYQLQVEVDRFDKTKEVITPETAPQASVFWNMTAAVEGVRLDHTGLLHISKLPTTKTIPVEVIIYEGQNVIKAYGNILITSESTPVSIKILGDDVLRYLGSYEYRCVVKRINDTEEDVTADVYWKLLPVESRVVFENNTLSLGKIWERKDFELKAVYQEGEIVLESSVTIQVRGVLPLYGAGGFGINTDEEAFEILKDKMYSNRGGNLSLFVEKDEYGYLFYPRDLGEAEFIPIGQNKVSGWDGANNMGADTDNPEIKGPREIEVVYEDGLRDIFYLYRTNNKGFDFASFSVTFKKNN